MGHDGIPEGTYGVSHKTRYGYWVVTQFATRDLAADFASADLAAVVVALANGGWHRA